MARRLLYVNDALTTGEDVIKVGHFHWMYDVKAFSWVIMGILLAFVILCAGVPYVIFEDLRIDNYPNAITQLSIGDYLAAFWRVDTPYRIAGFIVFLLGLFQFGHMLLIKATTEIAVTNRRLILKQGLIARNVQELVTNRIEGVNVNQGIIGRILDYGKVQAYGTGNKEVFLPEIAEPIELRKAVQMAKEAQRDEMG
jgi:hypothetical protein